MAKVTNVSKKIGLKVRSFREKKDIGQEGLVLNTGLNRDILAMLNVGRPKYA